MLADQLGRPIRDLRISVTDRCNFRCTYCMPKSVFDKDYIFLPRAELLSFEEIIRLAKAFVDCGVEKIRLTGGEPLLRKNIERLIAELARLPVEITLTTNGSLLKQKARALRDAGLTRLTVSLDALDDAIFRSMTDADFPLIAVLEGIDSATSNGFTPIKINCVVRRGVNDQQILTMARHFRHSGHIMRFIEYMDVGSSNGWRMDEVVPAAEIIALIGSEFALEHVGANYHGEVAQRWRYVDGAGEIGVIASVTQAFCSACTRARLSTDGKLYSCLFAQSGHDLRPLLRNQNSQDSDLVEAISAVWQGRTDRYSELRTNATNAVKKIEMSYIGG